MKESDTDKYSEENKKSYLSILLMIGGFSLLIRFLMSYNFHTNALLYVGIPYVISVLLLAFTNTGIVDSEKTTWKTTYWNYFRNGLIIMFGSSIVLFEGFVCVIMFLPIYMFVLLIGFIASYFSNKYKDKKSGQIFSHIIPIIIILSAFEGTTEQFSFEREHSVTVTYTTTQSFDEIKNNLLAPLRFDQNLPWFLKFFPQPYSVKAGSLNEGDIHEINYRYHRWFITNTHEGKILLEISKVEDTEIQTTFIQDTSYLSNYLSIKGTKISYQQSPKSDSEITLTINFERKLDPSWYFKPLEEYGVEQTANYLMQNIILRKTPEDIQDIEFADNK